MARFDDDDKDIIRGIFKEELDPFMKCVQSHHQTLHGVDGEGGLVREHKELKVEVNSFTSEMRTFKTKVLAVTGTISTIVGGTVAFITELISRR